MNFFLPDWLVRALGRIDDWINVAVWERGRLHVLRLDLIGAVVLVIGIAYGWHTAGWLGVLQAAASAVFGFLAVRWIVRPTRA